MRRALFLSAFVAASTTLLAVAEAQTTTSRNNQQNQNERNERDRKDGADRSESSFGSDHWKNLDHCFATCVAYANQEEIALARIAKQRAKSTEVKQFAEMMIRDHEELLTKLQKFAPEASRPGALGTDGGSGQATREGSRSNLNQTAANERDNESSKVRTADNRNENTNGNRNRDDREGRGARLSDIERELAEQCISSARKKLESKSGHEFDKCYIHEQIAKHMEMKDKLTVYQRHASADLASVFASGLKTTEHHLMKAEEIAKDLEGSDSTSRRESSK